MTENLFSRILRGSTKPKDEPKKAEPVPPAETPGAVEQVLNVPVSRRNVLGGAAATAGHMAMPQEPVVIQEGIKEAAALLAPRVGRGQFSFVGYVQKFNKSFEYLQRKSGFNPKDEYEGTGEFSPTIESTFAKGAPLTSKGEWAHQQFFEISWLSRLGLPDTLKIKDLKNPEIISEAYRLAGVEFPEDKSVIRDMQGALGVLQRVTGVSDDQTVGELEKVYGGRIASIATRILDDPKFFPAKAYNQMTRDERERHEIALKYLEDTIGHTHLEIDPGIAERIKSQRTQYRDYWNAREKEREAERMADQARKDAAEKAKWAAEDRKAARQEAAEKRKRREFNDKLKRRESIECRVQTAIREPRDEPNARVYIITPRRYDRIGDFHGLTRMHIQHLRQMLTVGVRGRGLKKPTLDSFDPATTKVEEIGNAVRVSTTDPAFQVYLRSFTEGYRTLEIPNRLQMTVQREQEEAEEE